ncbi:glycoside hydrolase family 16 protein [Coprinellus micaceus]|uniref:Glycoside hydrolase family 16 protein n=1 Tax=Coprinellus micaceus TaxID=71717 RepID=A0A4Y7S2F6_COPMI|nr:glycoside hydrolase family 16 protein [Coprinellus micaceus]
MLKLFSLASLLTVVWLARIPGGSAGTYSLTNNVVGSDFYNFFNWQAQPDPTHGRVEYVDQATGRSLNLTYASGDTFVLRTESRSILNPAGPGRPSVRIRSKKTFTTHVAVFDLRHMPQGCGTWPAIWETEDDNWPNDGEIDILEGVNDQGPNAATLHTLPGCTMPAERVQTGINGQLDCDWTVNGNTGCGVRMTDPTSYGPPFNQNGGGWYVVERTTQFIKVWFWSRNNPSVPVDIKNRGVQVNTDSYGTPAAHFPNTQCDLERFFKRHFIIINLTLCGDWAGSVYGNSGCPGTCVEFVDNNPQAFREAYFDFAGIRVYE